MMTDGAWPAWAGALLFGSGTAVCCWESRLEASVEFHEGQTEGRMERNKYTLVCVPDGAQTAFFVPLCLSKLLKSLSGVELVLARQQAGPEDPDLPLGRGPITVIIYYEIGILDFFCRRPLGFQD
jgi:hypothetical protein